MIQDAPSAGWGIIDSGAEGAPARSGTSWFQVKLAVATAVAVGTLWSAPRGVQFWDTSTKIQLAQNVLDGKGAILTRPTPDDEQYVVRGGGGRAVSQYPFLSWATQIPTVLLTRAGGPLFEGLPTLLALVWISILLVEWARRAGASPFAGALGALVSCLGTALWPMAALGYDSLFVALALASLAMAASGDERRWRWAKIGHWVGLAYCVRVDGALLTAVALWLASRERPAGFGILRRLLSGMAGALPWLAASLAYTHYRFGEMVRSKPVGRSLIAPFLSEQHLRGMLGLLVSPGKGLLWFGPPIATALLLLAPGTPRSFRTAAAVVGIYLIVAIPFFGAFTFWHGDWCWGPRYLVAAYLLVAPAAWEAWRRFSSNPRQRAAVVAAAVAAVVLQASPVIGRPIGTHLMQVVAPLARASLLSTKPITKPPLPADHELLYFHFEKAIWWRHPQAILRAAQDPEELPAVLRDALRAMAVPMAALLVLLILLRSEEKRIAREGTQPP